MNIIKVKSYSRIEIGKSETRVKECILISDFELFPEFRTMPFGANRTRFQIPEMFKYKLINLEKKKYKLIVERLEKPNNLTTANFFWTEGWNFNLVISNIININCNKLRRKILRYLPYNYGSTIIDIPNNFNPEIGIIVPIFGRYNYVKQFIESLNNTIMNNVLILFFDESKTKNVNDDKIKTYKYLKNIKIKFPNIKIFKNKHGNMNDSLLIGFDLLCSFCKHLVNLDPDTIHKKYWLSKGIDLYKKLQGDKILLVSCFNTINNNRHQIIKENEDYYEKKSIGGCNMIFSNLDYNNYIRYCLISHKWDSNIINLLKKKKSLIVSTKPSTIQHIGKVTSIIRKDKSIDIAFDF